MLQLSGLSFLNFKPQFSTHELRICIKHERNAGEETAGLFKRFTAQC